MIFFSISRSFTITANLFGYLLLIPLANADPDHSRLQIEDTFIVTDVPASSESPFNRLYSGWRFRTPETQELQSDDFENPAFAAVDYGSELWSNSDGVEGISCSSCHGEAEYSMSGVRAKMPKWDSEIGKPQTMETQINQCRTTKMKAKEWEWESPEMLGMSSYIGLQSRGMPVDIGQNEQMKPWLERGKSIYYKRFGQLDLSCATCHEQNYGRMIRADHLSQGHSNGFPTYRLKWGSVGSLHRRFKGCMKNIRATPYAVGSDAFIALEVYLASRAEGLSVETPSVRN